MTSLWNDAELSSTDPQVGSPTNRGYWSSDPQDEWRTVEDVNEEVELRLAAIRRWIDHAEAGDCDQQLALDAIEGLTASTRTFVAGGGRCRG